VVGKHRVRVGCARQPGSIHDGTGNNFLVPAIAQCVPESEQKSFNNKVLKSLGLWDSRMHLVGMHEAVLECDNLQEGEIFKQAIPSIPQLMIPRWKRNLYDAKVEHT
jgi:hypothetical protein